MLYRDFCINFGILLTFLPITETCRENQIALTRYYVNNLIKCYFQFTEIIFSK